MASLLSRRWRYAPLEIGTVLGDFSVIAVEPDAAVHDIANLQLGASQASRLGFNPI
jgi:hypothetical protein